MCHCGLYICWKQAVCLDALITLLAVSHTRHGFSCVRTRPVQSVVLLFASFKLTSLKVNFNIF